MRIEIEIPKEFETDYNGDKFKEFFSRVLCDIEKGKCLCGNYEKETAEMFLKAFDESKIAFDTEKVIEELEKAKNNHVPTINGKTKMRDLEIYKLTMGYAIDIVKKGGVE